MLPRLLSLLRRTALNEKRLNSSFTYFPEKTNEKSGKLTYSC